MSLGNHLFHARKKKGMSQEEVAENPGISRQTVSKWETDETLPDIRQSKRLAVLYGVSLDELVEFDIDIHEIQEVIEKTSSELSDKTDWTKVWSKKYRSWPDLRERLTQPVMRQSWISCYAIWKRNMDTAIWIRSSFSKISWHLSGRSGRKAAGSKSKRTCSHRNIATDCRARPAVR
jgi:transcriptional regulator with XRE-family HTH domain